MEPYGIWISYWTIVRKELVRLFRIWSQTLLPPIITTGLYFLIFGEFIGSQVAPIGGVSYMQFIVPGLVLMAAINSAFMNTAFSFYSAKFQKTVEEVMVSPTPYLIVVLGHITGGVLRALITALLVMGLALFFTSLSIHSLFVTVVFIFLTALLFSLAGLVNGVFATSFDTVSIVPTFVLTPLTYLGGVFYSVSLLPPIWQEVSHWNPIFYMVNGFRYGMLGITDTPVALSFGILAGLCLLFIAINWYLFKSGRGLRT
jgi:ABC-2 type transport system permease protein